MDMFLGKTAEEVTVKVISEFEVNDTSQIEKSVKLILSRVDTLKPGKEIEKGPIRVKIIDIKPPNSTKIDVRKTFVRILNGHEAEECPDISFDDIEGYGEYKAIILVQLQRLKNLQCPRSILIYGSPGTGKTSFVYAIIHEAKKLGINVFKIDSSIFDEQGLFGVSARRIREIFDKAKENQPSIIIIDELEQFGLKRDEKRDDEGIRILDEILKGIDEIEHENLAILVVAVTNIPKLLDKALIRRGRFTYYFKMNGLPSSALLNLLKRHLKREGVKLDGNFDSEILLDLLSKLSPADVVALAKRLKDKAIIYNKERVNLDLTIAEIDKMLEENKDSNVSFI